MIRWCLSGRLAFLFGVGVFLLANGCGGDTSGVGKTAPVSGTVTFDDKPLEKGSVAFHPDGSKGNKGPVVPAGEVNNGQYSLASRGKAGAPPGWYKVTISETEKLDSTNPTPKSKLNNTKYADPAKTTLSVEVVESPAPGAYDFKLKAE